MTNKLKGLLIGFGLFFSITLYFRVKDYGFSGLEIQEKFGICFGSGIIGGVFGYLVGSSIKEKTS